MLRCWVIRLMIATGLQVKSTDSKSVASSPGEYRASGRQVIGAGPGSERLTASPGTDRMLLFLPLTSLPLGKNMLGAQSQGMLGDQWGRVSGVRVGRKSKGTHIKTMWTRKLLREFAFFESKTKYFRISLWVVTVQLHTSSAVNKNKKQTAMKCTNT